jgi:hypothetical protein
MLGVHKLSSKAQIIKSSINFQALNSLNKGGMVLRKEASIRNQKMIHDKSKNVWKFIGLGLTNENSNSLTFLSVMVYIVGHTNI